MKCSLRLPLAKFTLDVDFDLAQRSIGVFGPSGAGKTSLLECLAGWRAPTAGRIEFDGKLWFDAQSGVSISPRERGVGYVPQDGLLFPHWSVERNLRAGAAGRGVDESTLAAVVDVLELESLLARDVATCSGGERQRVALGRALASSPDLLLLDEPLGALDRPLRRRILPYLVAATEAFDVPFLFVSHDATEVQAICDHAIVLERGSITAQGDPADVLGSADRAGTDFENLLRGRVVMTDDGRAELVMSGGVRVEVPARELHDGATALFGLRADDVLLATTEPVGLSARNAVHARVESIDADGQDVLVAARCTGPTGDAGPLWRASVTAGAVSELGVAVGGALRLVFKTQSCHRLG